MELNNEIIQWLADCITEYHEGDQRNAELDVRRRMTQWIPDSSEHKFLWNLANFMQHRNDG